MRFSLLLTLLLLAGVGLQAAGARVQSASSGNAFYTVTVEDRRNGRGLGSFTVGTGAEHPDGSGRALLFGGDASPPEPGASYMSVRSYTTGTDYVQTLARPASGNLVASLDSFGTVSQATPAGSRAVYDLPGGDQSADSLSIVSEIAVSGTTFAGSSIRFSAGVSNTGDTPVAIGIRYLFDVDPAGDDGPALTRPGPAPAESRERTYSPALYAVGLAAGDDPLQPPSLFFYARPEDQNAAPDRLTFAYWPDAGGSAFDYDPAPRDVAGDAGLNDAALLYYFGASEETAIRLNPGEQAIVSLTLAGSAPPGAEFCANGADDDGDGLVDTQDPDCGPVSSPTPAPTAGPTPTPVFPVELPRTGGLPAPPTPIAASGNTRGT